MVAQMSFGEAVAALKAAVDRGCRRYGAFASGVVRWELPLPRDANALLWLQVVPNTFVFCRLLAQNALQRSVPIVLALRMPSCSGAPL
jgi:hypothetical protein